MPIRLTRRLDGVSIAALAGPPTRGRMGDDPSAPPVPREA
jgi:hypothetical protein